MHIKRRNLIPVLPWTCTGCSGFYGTALIISSFQRTAHKLEFITTRLNSNTKFLEQPG